MGSAFEPGGSWPFVCFLTTSFPSAKDLRSLLAHTSPPADLSSLACLFSLGNAHRLSRRARSSLFSASAAAHTAARGCGSWQAAFAQGRRSAVWLKPAAIRNAAWSNIEPLHPRRVLPLGPRNTARGVLERRASCCGLAFLKKKEQKGFQNLSSYCFTLDEARSRRQKRPRPPDRARATVQAGRTHFCRKKRGDPFFLADIWAEAWAAPAQHARACSGDFVGRGKERTGTSGYLIFI